MAKGETTRTRILDEAVRLASRDGLQGLSIGGLAAALSLSKSGLFAHFGSKEALQVAVLEHAGARFRRLVLAPLSDIPAGRERLRTLLQGSLDWMDDPEFKGGCPIFAACFELDDREGAARDALVARQHGMKKFLVGLFGEVAGPGADLEQAAFEFRAITLAYHFATRVLRDPSARTRTWKAFEALLERVTGEPSAP
ncbi:MAG TPA: TetR/AcrR family transcriptional regulator [Anaeromyxobacteraceae bacterium]|nr:TetR/AcrR family transcriptional regulator [Anaeromyxobacteraceae bacterium]